ncbi:MAG: hypothetical protein KJ555_06360 [Proteobacteria bacterium]|nr:hypothetical protein [Pseudomonadota bacterium]
MPALKTARFSQQFLAAALKVQAAPRTEREALVQQPSLVAYYLLGHAIELALKSYLLVRGLSPNDLRRWAYGHKLDVLLAECRRRRFGIAVKLTPPELKLIQHFSEIYAGKELEYQFGGTRALPQYADLVSLTERLSEGVFEYAKRKHKANRSVNADVQGCLAASRAFSCVKNSKE